MENNFTFDSEKAYAMCSELQQSWNLGIGTFKHYRDKQMPEATLPSNVKPKSKEHANYFFWGCVANYQTVADELFPRMRNLHETQPEMFDPVHIRKVDDNELSDFVKQIKHMPDEMFRRWRYDADLFKKYGDNIINTHKTENIVDAQKEVMKFNGFAYKQSALLLYWLQKYKIIETFDETDLNIPVDVHVQRISVRRDVCDFDGKTRQGTLEKFLRNEYQRFFKENKEFSPFETQGQMWVLGSQSCVKNTKCKKSCVFEKPCKRDLFVEREARNLQKNGKSYHGASGMCWVDGNRPYRPRNMKHKLADNQQKLDLGCDC